MKILELRALHGPNAFAHFPVCRLTIDLGDLSDSPTDRLPDLTPRLLAALPGLRTHHCSRGCEGGFVERLHEGTYLAHVVEHVAIELARLGGLEITYGKTIRIEKPGTYFVALEMPSEDGARTALERAVELVSRALDGEIGGVGAIADEIREAVDSTSLGPSTLAVVRAAEARGIPWARLDRDSLIVLGHGVHRRFLQATMTERTGLVAAEIASDKQLTKEILERAGVPTPRGELVRDEDAAVAALERLGAPVVVKPLDGNQGKGVSTNLRTEAQVRAAFAIARAIKPRVIVEEHVEGRNYRVLVIDGKIVAAAERMPPRVTGDGEQTIRELVLRENADPRRGRGHGGILSQIPLDAICERGLADQGLTLDTVPAAGAVVALRESANLSTGGTARDVTDELHPSVRSACERAARAVGLDVCGIDLVTPDATQPITHGAAVIEVNAAPGIRMHVHPSEGAPRDAGGAIVRSLFPRGDGRIPIVAITGTNGKTTVTRMVAHAIAGTGARVGAATTDGVWIGGERVLDGDTTGAGSARMVLFDPTVEVAVLETARGGIARRGLGWDLCDVSVMTNIGGDHLGQDGIWTIDDLVHVKSLVAERTRPGGTVVLNAEDPRLMALVPRLEGRRIVLFALDPRAPALLAHLRRGGRGYAELDGWLCELDGEEVTRIVRASELAFAYGGSARFQIANALAAIAAVRAHGLEIDDAADAIRRFEDNPGRLTLLKRGDAHVLVDYGHNAEAIRSIAEMVAAWPAARRSVVVSLPGDRTDEALDACASVIAGGFDRVIAKDDLDRRGRREREVPERIARACAATHTPCEIASDEVEAIARALERPVPGELVVVISEDPSHAVAALLAQGAERARVPPATG